MAEVWSMQNINDPLYRAKFVNCPDIIEDWLSEHGGLAGRDVLEFGCGEGTMSLGMALRKETRRVVGVEILDVLKQCLHLARREIRLESLPANLDLFQITPGQQLLQFGQFDLVYSWSVFEHVCWRRSCRQSRQCSNRKVCFSCRSRLFIIRQTVRIWGLGSKSHGHIFPCRKTPFTAHC